MKLLINNKNLKEISEKVTEDYALKIGQFEEDEINDIINHISENEWENAVFSGDTQFKTGFDKEYKIKLDLSDNEFSIKKEDKNKSPQFNTYTSILDAFKNNKLNCIKNLILDKNVIKFLKKYFGYAPMINTQLGFFHSEYAKSNTGETINWQQHMHIDALWTKTQIPKVHYKFSLRFFVLLKDVDETDGPTTAIKGTTDEDGVIGKYLYHNLPSVNSGRIPNEEWFYKTFSKDRFVKCIGKKGDIFAVRTDGWHCGGRSQKNGKRTTFQIDFNNIQTLNAIRNDKYVQGENFFHSKVFTEKDLKPESFTQCKKIFGDEIVNKMPWYFLLLENFTS